MSFESDPNRSPPPPRRRSRPITMALLGAAVLSSCVCCLVPTPADDPQPGAAGGDFGPQPGTADSGRTPTTDRGDNRANQPVTHHRSYMPFWIPLFFGRGGGYSAPRPSPSVRPTTSPNVTRGGFGRSGFFGGGG